MDLTDRETANNVAMIGLLDKAGLESGAHEYQRGAYIYINNRADGSVRIGVTDGNAGGELVQTAVVVPAAVADAGPLGTVFTVDGTVDPATCATLASDAATAVGCMTLMLDGFRTITDSYGTIAGSGGPDEFATGAIPGVTPQHQGKFYAKVTKTNFRNRAGTKIVCSSARSRVLKLGK